jgi:signal transduction histidine kinase
VRVLGLTGRIDAALRSDARVVETRSLDGVRVPTAAVRDRIVQVVAADGSVRVAGEPAGGADADPLLGTPFPFEPGSGRHVLSVDDPALGSLRLLAQPIRDDGSWLVVARSDDLVAGANRSVVRALVVGVPVLTAGLGVLVWLGVGRALRPVEDMRRTVADISERHLSARVPVRGSGDEIDRLAATMNEMLDRLDAAAGRERQLVADASHELRSPVASVRALLETRGQAADPAEHDAEALAALSRLQELVEGLLELASHDASVPSPARPVDLDELVMERARALRASSGLTVDTSLVSGGQVTGAEEGLRRVVDNLSSNAGRHARTQVRFEVREAPGWVQLVVADDGPGIPEADRELVFQRFIRLDEARDRDRAGAGLGLAIVAGVVARHHGQVAVDEDPHLGGARFVVSLPAVPPPPSADGVT